MSNKFRYTLDRSSKKFTCPGCGQKRFNKYIDSETREYLPDEFGLCDRLNNCGYKRDPYTTGYGKGKYIPQHETKRVTNPKTNLLSVRAYIPISVLQDTLNDYDKNVFITNLNKNLQYPFSAEVLEKLVNLYFIGTNSDWYTGSVCFPFIDINNNIRAIQVKQFDSNNNTLKYKDNNGDLKSCTSSLPRILKHKYTKLGQVIPEWLNKYEQNEIKFSCFFGEHLLRRFPSNPVYLVEAPKTCVIGTLYYGFPEDRKENPIWLGVYNLSSLTKDRCEVLKGRRVVLIPDLKACELWKERAKEISAALPTIRFEINQQLEKIATPEQKEKGNDIADFLILKPHTRQPEFTTLIKRDQEEFLQRYARAREEKGDLEVKSDTIKKYRSPWDIKEIEAYYLTATIPNTPIKLNRYTLIENPQALVRSHLEIIRRHNGNPTFKGYLLRLENLMYVLSPKKVC